MLTVVVVVVFFLVFFLFLFLFFFIYLFIFIDGASDISHLDLGLYVQDVIFLQLINRLRCLFSAYFNDIVVGAVCCREDKSEGQRRLYIMTLGCLAPYRRLGIGKLCILYIIMMTLGCLVPYRRLGIGKL